MVCILMPVHDLKLGRPHSSISQDRVEPFQSSCSLSKRFDRSIVRHVQLPDLNIRARGSLLQYPLSGILAFGHSPGSDNQACSVELGQIFAGFTTQSSIAACNDYSLSFEARGGYRRMICKLLMQEIEACGGCRSRHIVQSYDQKLLRSCPVLL